MLSPDTKYHPEHAADSADAEAPPAWGASWGFRMSLLRYHRLVYRVAWQLLQDRGEAEDVCQESFLRLWRHYASVRQRKEWLLRVARNLCLSRLRQRGRLYYNEQTLEAAAAESGDMEQQAAAQPEHNLQLEQRALSLRQAVERLPEPQRSLVVLFDLEGLDGAACARILDLSPSQVKVYLHRARKRLRSQLEHCL